MNRLLNNVKQGITKALGRISLGQTGPTQNELDELESEIHEFQTKTDALVEFIKLYNSALISYNTAFENFYMPIDYCKICSCEPKHHNPDKRFKSGYGKCLCGHCFKYRSSMSILTIDSIKLESMSIEGPTVINNNGTISISYTMKMK